MLHLALILPKRMSQTETKKELVLLSKNVYDLHKTHKYAPLHNNNITLNMNYIQMMLITLYSQVQLVA